MANDCVLAGGEYLLGVGMQVAAEAVALESTLDLPRDQSGSYRAS